MYFQFISVLIFSVQLSVGPTNSTFRKHQVYHRTRNLYTCLSGRCFFFSFLSLWVHKRRAVSGQAFVVYEHASQTGDISRRLRCRGDRQPLVSATPYRERSRPTTATESARTATRASRRRRRWANGVVVTVQGGTDVRPPTGNGRCPGAGADVGFDRNGRTVQYFLFPRPRWSR